MFKIKKGNFMKKVAAFAAALSVLCISTACGTKIDNTELKKETESTVLTEESTDTTVSSETEITTEHTTAVSTTTVSSTTVTTTTTAATSAITTTEKKSDDNKNDNTEKADTSSYKYDASDNELISKAQSMFDEAVEVYNKFIYDGAYQTDDSELYFSDNGESMLKITDPSVTSVEDVVNDFEKYFSEKYEDPVPMCYIESNGNVYYIQTDRGSDASYVSTTITGITKKTDDEVFFTAVSSYDDGTTKENTYSLVYGENGVEWKTGEFKLPN